MASGGLGVAWLGVLVWVWVWVLVAVWVWVWVWEARSRLGDGLGGKSVGEGGTGV